MCRLLYIVICVGLLVAVTPNMAGCTREKTPPPAKGEGSTVLQEDLMTLVQGNNEFALDLYARLAKVEGNVVFSPYSISTALAMTYGGARGETGEQMAKVLHFNLGQEKLHPAFGQLAADLQKGGKDRPFHLYFANSLWGQSGFPFEPEFRHLTDKNYDGGFREVDFRHQTEEARKSINGWVEKQTKDKIKNLLLPGVLTPDTRLVIANALYFKGIWKTPFPKEDTKDADFEKTPTEKVSVPMMSNSGAKFNYCDGDDCQWLELPYQGERLSMVVILPRKKGDLANIESTLSRAVIEKNIANLKGHYGSVWLPRFKATYAYSLVGGLKAMGMTHAFALEADFSGIAPRRLHIGAVEHKAYIDVDEVGTEAAAATGIVKILVSDPPPFSFRADHPFLFFIRDRQTGSILFLARISDPRS